ncbi:CoA pyrophosphatase [Algicola sagamiensis]|uniref:CoA pyrophosphatase n=1 Tax=Algicola sagamiensis TaxID=163869 RepID=UPI00037643D2|nr:CoA pyrophosphatase [Algicola sagamiensis]
MDRQTFLTHYNLHQYPDEHLTPFRFPDPAKAAVLVALRETDDQLEVILTRRAAHLRTHANQISFPGGKIDSGETVQEAAVREAWEEIRLSPDFIELRGELPSFQTISGFELFPVIGFVDPKATFEPQEDEVAEILVVPFQHFLAHESHYTHNYKHGSHQYDLHFYPYKHYLIWGATAAVLHQLVLQVTKHDRYHPKLITL